MNDFTFYFGYGWEHIISWDALDHLLFITALTAIYSPRTWKQVLILITAFTIGHSLTLGLSVYDVIRLNSKWVEFLISITILVTSVFNIFSKKRNGSLRLNYFLALFFGLIHGMGFANTIRFMLARDQHIAWPLFGFNLGLEAGQIIVVCVTLSVFYLVVDKGGLSQKWWVWTLSGIAFFISLYMAFTRWPI